MPIVLYLITILTLLFSLKKNKNDSFLDKHSSNTIKGFFILLIVFSHILYAFPYGGFGATPLGYFRGILGQLIVSMFFFVSGYGIIYSIDRGGEAYSKSIITNRVLRIILYTIASLIPFFIYSACLNKQHEIQDYFLAVFGLRTFGNEYWFLFAILVCYLSSAIVFFFTYKHKVIPIILATLCIIFYIVLYMLIHRDRDWEYNTIICFPLGLFAAFYRDKINGLLNRKWLTIALLPICVGVVVGCYALYRFPIPHMVLMTISNIFFCTFFVCLTKLFTLKSPVLEYLGKASFAIFIMHRFVICCFQDLGTIPNEHLNYLVLFTTSVLIGIPFYYLYKVIDKYITNPIVKWNRNLIIKHSKIE